MSQERTYPMTQEAFEKLRDELKEKLDIGRPALAARLKVAIAMGDLKENAEYISAKEDQGFFEGRVQELEELVRGADIIELSSGGSIVQIGVVVTIQEKGEDDLETYTIAGAVEANPVEGKISNESPLGLALIGHKVGDKVKVKAPDGKVTFKIISIE